MKYYQLEQMLLGNTEEPVLKEPPSLEDMKDEMDFRVTEMMDHVTTHGDAINACEQLQRLRKLGKRDAGVYLLTLEALGDVLGANDLSNVSTESVLDSVKKFAKRVWEKVVAAWRWVVNKVRAVFGLKPTPIKKSSNSKWGENYRLKDKDGRQIPNYGWDGYHGLEDFIQNGEKIIKAHKKLNDDAKSILVDSFNRAVLSNEMVGHQKLDDTMEYEASELVDSFNDGGGLFIDTLRHRITFNKGEILIVEVVGMEYSKMAFIDSLKGVEDLSDYTYYAETMIDSFDGLIEANDVTGDFGKVVSTLTLELSLMTDYIYMVNDRHAQLQLILWSLYFGWHVTELPNGDEEFDKRNHWKDL